MPKVKSPLRQRHRIILLFVLGIVLPSLLLGYLAFRGVQNDRALLEKERLEKTRQAADRVIQAVDEGIAAVEKALSGIVAAAPGEPSPVMADRLRELMIEHPLIDQVFSLRGLEDIDLPAAEPLYVPDGRRNPAASSELDPSDKAAIAAGQLWEFQEKNYARALDAYIRALGRSNDAVILSAMARVQRKAGRLEDASATYKRIVAEHGGTVMPGGLPLGPSAALEICAIAHELGDGPRALEAAIGFYRSLLRREWLLEKTEFDFFSGRGKALIKEHLVAPPAGGDMARAEEEFAALKNEEAAARSATERFLAFQSGAAPFFEAEVKAALGSPGPDGSFNRVIVSVGNFSYLTSIQPSPSSAPGSRSAAWGLILDPDRLKEGVLRPALLAHLTSPDTSWTVRSRDGKALSASEEPAQGPAVLSANFASGFPNWTLEFRHAPAHLIKTFLLSRRGLYSFVFLLIAGILVFGLVLTIRSVSHELELARMKSDFVSTISHEFKSPLTSIRQLAEMLQAGRVPSEERRRKYYDVLLEQSERLTLLTDNILGLARIEEGRAKFAFEKTDIGRLVAEVIASVQERVRHEGFEIGLEIEDALPSLEVDRAALAQALTNLLDNAVKYSGEERRVSVGAALERGSVAIAVRDFGVGIGADDLVRIFERFYRAGDELTRTVKGSGLGLTLVREIVNAHNGKVDVRSEPGKGSTFTIRLPLPPSPGGTK